MYNEDKTKWSYLAGMVDGEGCISIWRTRARNTNYATNKITYGSFNCRIQIYNTSEALMKWLIANFGGSYNTRTNVGEKHKISYNWRPKGANNTKKMLLGILPYLVIKREQATLALEYVEMPKGNPERRVQIYQRMRLLNQKGKTVTTNTLDNSPEPNTFFAGPDGILPAPHYSMLRPGDLKIESDLASDCESAPLVTAVA